LLENNSKDVAHVPVGLMGFAFAATVVSAFSFRRRARAMTRVAYRASPPTSAHPPSAATASSASTPASISRAASCPSPPCTSHLGAPLASLHAEDAKHKHPEDSGNTVRNKHTTHHVGHWSVDPLYDMAWDDDELPPGEEGRPPPRALEVLTKAEIAYLFLMPFAVISTAGVISAWGVATYMDVHSLDEFNARMRARVRTLRGRDGPRKENPPEEDAFDLVSRLVFTNTDNSKEKKEDEWR